MYLTDPQITRAGAKQISFDFQLAVIHSPIKSHTGS